MKRIPAPTKHTWWFRNIDIDGRPGNWIGHKCKKFYYNGPSIKILLAAAMIDKSIKAKGAGDSQRCPGSMCMRDYSKVLNEVGVKASDPLYVEWLDSRVIISTKVNKLTHLPEECIVLTHDQAWFPKLNDDPSGKGAKKLKEMVMQSGPIEITLASCSPQTGARTDSRAKGSNGGGALTTKKRRGSRGRFARYMNVGASREDAKAAA
jgi:hypothetical protein